MKHDSEESLRAEAIDEYFEAAALCLKARKPDDGFLGYPAALLLLCATDAIGHILLPKRQKGPKTRLNVLNNPPFDQKLTHGQLDDLIGFYRHALAHNGSLGRAKFLIPEEGGSAFEIGSSGGLVGLRVPAFHSLILGGWKQVRRGLPRPESPYSMGSTLTPPSSGWVR